MLENKWVKLEDKHTVIHINLSEVIYIFKQKDTQVCHVILKHCQEPLYISSDNFNTLVQLLHIYL